MPTGLVNVLLIAAGGALGAVARYAVSGPILGKLGGRFPWGILAVNLVGCFFIGVVLYMYLQRGETDDRLRFFLVAGFLGSFTTFSAFGFDTFELLREGHGSLAIANILSNVVLGVALAALGWQIGRWLLGDVPAGV
ncbi:MAG: fluoride efflux transporter CrcB [Phycisphaerales bacterium]